MIIKPFQVVDYAKAELANGIGLERWELSNGVYPMLKYMESCGTFWTMWHNDTVVIIGGWHQAWAGICEVSLFPTRYFREHPLSAVKALKKKLSELTATYRRVQLNCRADECFTRFALRLGFKEEGRMKNFSYDGTDHLIMAIVRPT